MKTVTVSELRKRLNSYLADAQRGEEIIIKAWNRPVARLVPLAQSDDADREEAMLVAASLMTLPTRKKLPPSFWKMKTPKVSDELLARAISDDRDEG